MAAKEKKSRRKQKNRRPKQLVEDDAEFEDDGYGEGFDPDEAYGEPEYLSEDDFDDKDSK